jgi:uncharacterized protein|tara:strand:+ start:237 stop:1382 length:1146 start_codon:yes stop_codon:yes gene_type:complete
MDSSKRIANLDFIRGFALLGILVINVISFGLPITALFNHSTYGAENLLDWVVIVISSVFFEYKMMGLFSMLFGVGLIIFLDNAKQKVKRPKLLSFWRNFLLLFFGVIHISIWEGDILIIYALCAFWIILFSQIQNNKITIFFVTFLVFIDLLFINYIGSLYDASGNLILEEAWVVAASEGGSLNFGKFWFPKEPSWGNISGLLLVLDASNRAMTLMLVGILLYRLNIIQGTRGIDFYKKLMFYGFSTGLPFSIYSIYLLISSEYSAAIAITSRLWLTLSVIPMVLGYVGLLTIMNIKLKKSITTRLRACGKMAFTNYITQTLIGVVVLRGLFEIGTFSRSQLIIYIFAVWGLQIYWSKPIVDNFKFGPLEWLLRKLTYYFV